MACKTSFEIHHQFPKLAEESGFAFNTHRPRIHIDWNKIRLIDIDSLLKERKFYIIEQHLNDVLDCVFESEFDVRVLDEGVMKMFRLAQLALEYLQFCRHYLDRSVYVLRDEITSLVQELDTCKKDLREKEDEIRRLKKRSRHLFKNNLPYCNDNIATMIIKTLSQKGSDTVFTSPLCDSIIQYNKCEYCNKVFLNQLYLKSHIARRHANFMEPPQKNMQENNTNNENSKLSAEVTELKNKIKEMEQIIANNNHKQTNQTKSAAHEHIIDEDNAQAGTKNIKDAEESINNETYLLSKLEEWKKQEHENHNKEMDKLRNQIMESINTIKEKENQKSAEPNMYERLHETIKQQGTEILALQTELKKSKMKTEQECADMRKEAESQVAFWVNRAEIQSKQYELLLQKLNEVAKNAKESRALAETERERATQLKILLQQSLSSKTTENADCISTPENKSVNSIIKSKTTVTQTDSIQSEQEPGRHIFDKLHRKAQELLNVDSVTLSSSDSLSTENFKPLKTSNDRKNTTRLFIDDITGQSVPNKINKIDTVELQKIKKPIPQKTNLILNGKGPKLSKEKFKPNYTKNLKKRNSSNLLQTSPKKLVRAKITEEVNSRLVSSGVDPFKTRLSRNIFQRQRMQLHQNQELKAKKNPNHDKVRHTILAFLDTNTTGLTGYKKGTTQVPDYTSPTKVHKPFKNFTSVISNVKTKALSLVKLNELNVKEKKKPQSAEVAKRAMSLLKTPPGSTASSPISSKRSPIKAFNITQKYKKATNKNVSNTSIRKNPNLGKTLQTATTISNSEDSEESEQNYENTTTVQQSSKSIDNLIKSPARRPASATATYNHTVQKYTISDDNLMRTQSVTNLIDQNMNSNEIINPKSSKLSPAKIHNNSSDDAGSLSEIPIKKNFLEEHVQNTLKQTKSVLKNASSTSSLNKKKVLFDMDAIQMKSVSASPSQSLTEKSDGNEKYELGLVNLDGEEWDLSSIENEPLKNDTKIQNVTRTSPKIAELKEKIESQLARRNERPPTALVGVVDVLTGTIRKASSIAGSNTSLGSSILDDSESVPIINHKTIVKPKKVTAKDDSDIDISEFSIDGIVNKNESF